MRLLTQRGSQGASLLRHLPWKPSIALEVGGEGGREGGKKEEKRQTGGPKSGRMWEDGKGDRWVVVFWVFLLFVFWVFFVFFFLEHVSESLLSTCLGAAAGPLITAR